MPYTIIEGDSNAENQFKKPPSQIEAAVVFLFLFQASSLSDLQGGKTALAS